MHLSEEGVGSSGPLVLAIPSPGEKTSGLVVEEINDEAKLRGVKRGMAVSQAEVTCPGLQVRELDPGRCSAARDRLLNRLWTLCPAVEPWKPGVWYIGMQGLKWLFSHEKSLLDALAQVCLEEKYTAWITSASNRFTAWAAALAQARGLVPPGPILVPNGQEAQFVAPLPLDILPPIRQLPERLALLGIYTLGAFARLNPRSVERRYGGEALKIHRLARGEDECHLQPMKPPSPLWTSLLLDTPVWQAQGLIFLITPMIERLISQLVRDGRSCAEMVITLTLENRHPLPLRLRLAAPTEQPRVLMDLLILQLARTRLESGVIDIEVAITQATDPAHLQQDLFERLSSPTGVALTLARLEEALGADALHQAQLLPGYVPSQQYRWTKPRLAHLTQRGKGPPPPDEQLPAMISGMRKLKETKILQVNLSPGGEPAQLSWEGERHKVTHSLGPFYFVGSWWEEGFQRRYFRLRLDNDGEVLIYQDVQQDRWMMEGIYD